jgi:rubrerythrin
MYNYYNPFTTTPNMNCSTYGNDFTQQALMQSLELMREAVQGEREDELKYQYLISVAPTQEEVDIITSIRDDERNHREWFRQMYQCYTGQEIPRTSGGEELQRPVSYLQGVSDAVFGELGAMEKYRVIREGLPSRLYRDLVFRILTDEMKHATKYNYILAIHALERDRTEY